MVGGNKEGEMENGRREDENIEVFEIIFYEMLFFKIIFSVQYLRFLNMNFNGFYYFRKNIK